MVVARTHGAQLRVLHVASSLSPEWGGPATVVQHLAEELQKKGVQVTVVSTMGWRMGGRLTALSGVQSRVVPASPLSYAWAGHAWTLGRELSRMIQDVDVVHIHEPWTYPSLCAGRLATSRHVPFVVTPHGELNAWALGQKALKKRIYMRLVQRPILEAASAIQALTEDEARQIRALELRTPVVVIPNGISEEEFDSLPPPEHFEALYPETRGKRVVLFLGRIHPSKGLDILIRAFATVATRLRDAFLVVVGPDEVGYRAKLEADLKDYGIADRVLFTGMLTGAAKLSVLSRADVFVLPSYSEGFSLSVLEAMASRVPVVISRQCPIPDVQASQAGIVIDLEPDALASAVLSLLEHPEMRHSMGENGRRLAFGNYTWSAVADRMVRLYEDLLGDIAGSQ